jgi:hypothetical protein
MEIRRREEAGSLCGIPPGLPKKTEIKVDGFVKSPSAALRCNPALLDRNPPF